jgi:arylsulfatase A-like enzyme
MDAVDDTPDGQPIYGRLVFVDTHAPRSPAKKYQRRFTMAKATRKGRRLASYDASMLHLDQLFADLFVGMHERGRNVLFVFAADHGEGLNVPRHHGVGHGNHLYPSTTAVPWIIHHPALPDPGRSIAGLAMGVDLSPTLLDLLGLEEQPDFDGRSLADSVRGEAANSGREFAYAETFFRKSHKSAVYAEEHYLIRDHALEADGASFTDALFATADWKARDDQRRIAPDAYARLAGALDAWESSMEAVQAAAGAPLEIDPRKSTMKQLKALGYVD